MGVEEAQGMEEIKVDCSDIITCMNAYFSSLSMIIGRIAVR